MQGAGVAWHEGIVHVGKFRHIINYKHYYNNYVQALSNRSPSQQVLQLWWYSLLIILVQGIEVAPVSKVQANIAIFGGIFRTVEERDGQAWQTFNGESSPHSNGIHTLL